MACAGSGNQGLVATLPIMAVAERVGWRNEELVEAIALSYLISCYSTYFSGYVSALCGLAIKAGLGATAGITYYLGGNVKQIGSAIKNMAGDVTGILCDGAKVGCAIKALTIAGATVQSAMLALKGVELSSRDGIVDKTPEETIKNIGKISKAMIKADKNIIKILNNKI
jgi:L-cysteine desulfidase